MHDNEYIPTTFAGDELVELAAMLEIIVAKIRLDDVFSIQAMIDDDGLKFKVNHWSWTAGLGTPLKPWPGARSEAFLKPWPGAQRSDDLPPFIEP